MAGSPSALLSGNDKLLLDVEGKAVDDGLLLAWERTMTALTAKLWTCAGYMGTASAYGTVNFEAAWKFAPNVGVLVGYDLYNINDPPGTATIQVDIDI